MPGIKFSHFGRWPGVLRPPEAEAKCEISVQFLTFSCGKFTLMSIGAEIGQYIMQTHNSKNPEDSMGVPLWVRKCVFPSPLNFYEASPLTDTMDKPTCLSICLFVS